MNGRPAIPANLRRRVLVEAGHRCAIPTCRHIEVDIHHIIPWAEGQAHEYDNLIALCPNCHRRADRGQIDRKALRLYKLNLRFIHDKYSQLEMDILFELHALPQGTALPWPQFMNLLIKRILDSGFVAIKEESASGVAAGMKYTPDYLLITLVGQAFIDELGIKEL